MSMKGNNGSKGPFQPSLFDIAKQHYAQNPDQEAAVSNHGFP